MTIIKQQIRDLECDYRYYEMKFNKETDEEMELVYSEQMYQIGEQIADLKSN